MEKQKQFNKYMDVSVYVWCVCGVCGTCVYGGEWACSRSSLFNHFSWAFNYKPVVGPETETCPSVEVCPKFMKNPNA